MTARSRRTAPTLALLCLVLLGAVCGDDDDDVASGSGDSEALTAAVAGTYECGIDGQPTREVWELSTDQSLLVTVKDSKHKPEEGTWSIENGQVIINFSGANNDPFDIDGDRLVFAEPEGPDGTWVCTPTT